MSKSNERLVHNTLKTLGKDFIVVGKTRVRSWHAWLAIGVAVGVAAGVLFVANRSGEFEAGLAQVLPIAPTSGLVAHWKFDEGSGTTVSDSSGNGNTGTLTNGPTFTTGKIGQGLSFDGINDAVQIPDSNSLDAPQITVSAWVRKISNAPSWGMIVSRQAGTGAGDNWILFYNSSANDEYRFAVQGGTNIKLYRNGVQISDNAVSSNNDIGQWVHIVGTAEGAILPETSAVCIGGGANGVSRNCDSEYSNAVIDDARIYNRALSAQEILDLYNAGNAVVTSVTPTPAPTVMTTPAPTQTTTTTTGSGTLLQKSNLVYQGAFKVPHGTFGGSSFGYGGKIAAYNSANNSLFVTGHENNHHIAEITIPTPVNSGEFGSLNTASILQAFVEPTEGKISGIPPFGTFKVGGLLAYGGNLYHTAYAYYDGAQTQVLSHFKSGLNLSTQGDVQGPYQVGTMGAGLVDGWMIPIPAALQAALGKTHISGNCCLSIIGRTSWGPSAFGFNPTDLGVKNPVPVTPYLYYNGDHPTLGPWGGTSAFFNGSTEIHGAVFPEGTRSILYFGRHGVGPWGYGTGTSNQSLQGQLAPGGSIYCYDPNDSSRVDHAYHYEYQLWAYDVNDFIAVKNGQKNPWDVIPNVWTFNVPIQSSVAGGVAYDPSTQRIFLVAPRTEYPGAYPVIHVFKVQAGTTVTLTPTVSLSASPTSITSGTPTPIASTKFQINDRVQVNATTLNVRSTANGTILGAQTTNALGTVIGGPTNSGGFNWWNINYDTGTDGWSAEDYLIKYTAPSPTPTPAPTPTPTPTPAPIPTPGSTASCTHYASPTGGGNGLSQSSPFQIANFWSQASPGKTLCLLDGTYTGANSMITPPENLNGTASAKITLKVLN